VATVVIQISWKLVWKFVLMISWARLNMWHCPNMKNLVNTPVVTIVTQLSSNLVRMLVLIIAWMSSMGQVSDLGPCWPYFLKSSPSETTWARAKIFGIKHCLVDLYQDLQKWSQPEFGDHGFSLYVNSKD
jgi:hypothetical protein